MVLIPGIIIFKLVFLKEDCKRVLKILVRLKLSSTWVKTLISKRNSEELANQLWNVPENTTLTMAIRKREISNQSRALSIAETVPMEPASVKEHSGWASQMPMTQELCWVIWILWGISKLCPRRLTIRYHVYHLNLMELTHGLHKISNVGVNQDLLLCQLNVLKKEGTVFVKELLFSVKKLEKITRIWVIQKWLNKMNSP